MDRWAIDWAVRLAESETVAALLDDNSPTTNGAGVGAQERVEVRKASPQGGRNDGSELESDAGAHHSGLQLDIEVAATNDSSEPFFAMTTAGGVRYVAATTAPFIFYDAATGTYTPGELGGANTLGKAVQVEIVGATGADLARSAWNNRPVLLALRPYLKDAPGYSLDVSRRRIRALLTATALPADVPVGVPQRLVQSIGFNDPRTWLRPEPAGGETQWTDEAAWTGDGLTSRVRFLAPRRTPAASSRGWGTTGSCR